MKKIFLVILTISFFAGRAQKNVLLDQAFWKENPDVARVQSEIQKGNNPSEANPMGFDPVVYAINAQASTDVIKSLLDQKGNDVNKITHDARTYIFWAASRGNVEVVEYLISKGAKMNLEDSHGMTPIAFAANGGQTNPKLYEALVKAGADIKQKSQDGASLLLLGIANDKDFSFTNYLISKGLSLKDTDAAGNTAFNYVAKTGNIELMKSLIAKGVKYNDKAIIMAAQGTRGSANTIEVYQYLESLHLKPTAINSNNENVLHVLARKPNQESIIKYFLSKGVNANQADTDGNTPFILAASSNRDTATVALLLSQAKNINQVNIKGVSPLAMAVRNNSPEVVQFLIGKGAEVNAADAQGNNLAYYLIQSYNGQPANGQEGGRERSGQSPNGQAVNRQGAAEQAAKAQAPARDGQGANRQRSDGFAAKLKILQEAGFDVAVPQKDGNTLYHLAVAKNDLSLLKSIEDMHVDVNAKNKEGLTPLHKAAMLSKDDVILKYLLSIGAKKDITTEFKETALDLAKENESLSKNKITTDFLQ
ncbi:MAG: ankyrin repeat domain-containing protein [Chitinophagaceae bacterium]